MKNLSLLASSTHRSLERSFARALLFVLVGIFSLAGLSAQSDAGPREKFILQAEDQLRITFPGAPELDSELQVRRDGVISVPIVGEIMAAGKTPSELEAELEGKFENQLVSNEVMVVVVQSYFTYYLEGEVASPGIIRSFRQLSVLEAIIAAGGINKTTGKLKSVVVIRRQGDKYQRYELDLAAVIDGKKDSAFVLDSYDIVSIPQRVW
ncbi:polysaccharide biosynthesis/export family protein [Pelagicoccus sp. NFK12]|uniref:Polysaccharide biosynthesis/export family protein n=1 Tax=Pelagicoccus enzymogenes TaxID=2773457 RepID=A0A927F855_9BACT|nr:polysaccharide biosynthesis/export family protein [Pelagicoccus enzymogenes]MBD5779486.1 polysaccharide biosynthesis/export family protein [Pelagicoccus enzymogenes]MDQ8200999.1 polysaccharide biosynthesis/export family protein [Pelagicoccus enzymogenes]